MTDIGKSVSDLPSGYRIFNETVDRAELVGWFTGAQLRDVAADLDLDDADVDRKATLRGDIREFLDLLEAKAHAGVGLTLSARKCGILATMIRRIQDEAEMDLGYRGKAMVRHAARMVAEKADLVTGRDDLRPQMGIYTPTVHKTRTASREIMSILADGTIYWRQAGRCDLKEKPCSPTAWASWMKKHCVRLCNPMKA